MLYGGFQKGKAALAGLLGSLAALYEESLFIAHFYDFLGLPRLVRPPAAPRPVPRRVERGLRLEAVTFRYPGTERDALHEITGEIRAGEHVALVGENGSGKTTLVKLLCRLYDPTAGRMTLGGEVIYDDGWKVHDLRALRRDKIGFVFQAPYLIPFLDVVDNVALLPMLAGLSNSESRERALELLTALDVQHRAMAMPSQLSGGEQQRVAIARGLVNRPPVILADEPTAPLDSERAMAVMRILNEMAGKYQTAIIVVTHDEKIIPTFKRIYHIRDGITTEEAGEGKPIA